MTRFRAAIGSMRLRATLAATAIVFLALAVAAFALVVLVRDSLTDNVDTSIRVRADDIESLLRRGAFPDSLAVADDEASVIQILDSDDRIVAASENVAGAPPISVLRPPPGETVVVRATDVPVDLNEGFRVLARTVETPGQSFTMLIAGSLDDVHETTDALRGILQVGVPLLSIVVAGGTWVVVGRALAPVESIRREVASIGGQQLDRRVPVPRSRDEIARLAETMNEMLGRLQDAYQRQERFVADAAHELRSPLASLRVQLEVDGDEGTRHLLDEVIRMQRLVDDLLILARSDAGQLATQSSSVDLDDIVLGEAVRLREIGSRAAVDTSAVSAGQVRGNAEQLLRVVRNLLENAVRHAAARVVVTLREADGEVVLTVQDDGPGVPPAERSRIFERFARADSARARGSGGAGLGLAIARTIAESHGGTLGLADTDGGARFVLRLPAAN